MSHHQPPALPRLAVIALTIATLGIVSSCGVKGDLSPAAPLWGARDRPPPPPPEPFPADDEQTESEAAADRLPGATDGES